MPTQFDIDRKFILLKRKRKLKEQHALGERNWRKGNTLGPHIITPDTVTVMVTGPVDNSPTKELDEP